MTEFEYQWKNFGKKEEEVKIAEANLQSCLFPTGWEREGEGVF